MTDDAMREWLDPQLVACENARRAGLIDDTKSAMEGFYSGWQAATTALLEKLKSEGVMEVIAMSLYNNVACDGDVPFEEESNSVKEAMRKEARAVIEGLEKELVG